MCMCAEHAKQQQLSKQQLPELNAEVRFPESIPLSTGQVREYSPRHSDGELHATV